MVFEKQSKWPRNTIHQMPCRNPCILLHPNCIHILPPLLPQAYSAKLELGLAPPFPTNESAWSATGHGLSVSCPRSGPKIRVQRRAPGCRQRIILLSLTTSGLGLPPSISTLSCGNRGRGGSKNSINRSHSVGWWCIRGGVSYFLSENISSKLHILSWNRTPIYIYIVVRFSDRGDFRA